MNLNKTVNFSYTKINFANCLSVNRKSTKKNISDNVNKEFIATSNIFTHLGMFWNLALVETGQSNIGANKSMTAQMVVDQYLETNEILKTSKMI